MKIFQRILLIACVLVLFAGTRCSLFERGNGEPEKPSIVGEWLFNQTYEMYTDTPPDTVTMTQNITTLINADGTCSYSGTSIWDEAPQNIVEGSGTYTYDEAAGTFAPVYDTNFSDGVPVDVPELIYYCEITETTMTLTGSVTQAYGPAEPLIYTRQ